MSDSGSFDESDFDPFSISENLQLGQMLDLRQVFDQYSVPEMVSAGRQQKTITSLDRNVRAFEEWWEEELRRREGRVPKGFERVPVARITYKYLEEFRRYLLRCDRPASYINQTLQGVMQVLRCGVKNGLLTHAPTIRQLPAKTSFSKLCFTDEQLVDLWKAAPELSWPTRRGDFRECRKRGKDGLLHYDPGTAWRCCLILWVMYGFRSQDLVALEKKRTPISWGNISTEPRSPNPAGTMYSGDGWLSYVPSKDRRADADPKSLYLPLNRLTRSALDRLRPDDWSPDMAVCNWTFSSTSFYETWREWLDLAKIKSDPEDPFLPKNFRKTCVTRVEKHRPGVAGYIVGHGAGNPVTERHYHNPEEKVVECISTIQLPRCFGEILLPY